MSIYSNYCNNEYINEGVVDDIIKGWHFLRNVKNKRSTLVDSLLPIINRDVVNTVKNGIGIDQYSLFHSIDDKAFIKGKSDTFTVYFAPVETNKDVNDLSIKIANDLNTKINFREIMKSYFENGTYTYESWTALIRNTIKNSLFNSKLFTTAINQYWKAVENYACSETVNRLSENLIKVASAKSDEFKNCDVSISTNHSNYQLIISVSLY